MNYYYVQSPTTLRTTFRYHFPFIYTILQPFLAAYAAVAFIESIQRDYFDEGDATIHGLYFASRLRVSDGYAGHGTAQLPDNGLSDYLILLIIYSSMIIYSQIISLISFLKPQSIYQYGCYFRYFRIGHLIIYVLL